MIFNLLLTQPNIILPVSSSTISPCTMFQVPSISLVTVPFPFPSLATVPIVWRLLMLLLFNSLRNLPALHADHGLNFKFEPGYSQEQKI